MIIFAIAGWSGSGKTALIVELIRAFNARKKRVIALKFTAAGYHLQPRAKDSSHFLQAGADEVYIMSRNEMLKSEAIESPEVAFARLRRDFRSGDIVLLEGWYPDKAPIIEVFDPQRHEKPKMPLRRLAAIVSAQPFRGKIPSFPQQAIEQIVEFMEAYHDPDHTTGKRPVH